MLKWYSPYLDHIEPTDQLKDPKSRLQEYLQARKKPLPVYEVVDIQAMPRISISLWNAE